jgi:Cys-Gly metallodipeptidase DUG1
LTYGLRGISYYKVTISGPAKDLHSGVYGRMVHEPMTDLVILMSKLVDPQGNILIPGVEEMVQPPDEEERHVFLRAFTCTTADHGPSFYFQAALQEN